MGNTINVKASMSILNFTAGKGAKSIAAQIDQMAMKRDRIENNASMPQQQKDAQLAQLDHDMDDLNRQIEETEKKEKKKKQQKQAKEEKEQIEKTNDPKIAEIMQDMKQLITMAVNSEEAKAAKEEAADGQTDPAVIDTEQNLEEVQNLDPTKKNNNTISSSKDNTGMSDLSDLRNKIEISKTENNSNNEIDKNDILLKKEELKKYRKGLFVDKKA